MGLFYGNVALGGGGLILVDALPTANATEYNKHNLYLYNGEIYYITEDSGTYAYEKIPNATPLISFTIGSDSYQAESGMTWNDWCSSDYNTGEWVAEYGGVHFLEGRYDYFVQLNSTSVSPTDTITNGAEYTTRKVDTIGG